MSARGKIAAAALATAAIALAAGCGGDDGGDGGSTAGASTGGAPERASIVVATPFPSGLAFPELFVALANGYFDDEALDVTVEPLDGSGPILQGLETGQVQVGVTSPGPTMQAAERGGDPLNVYTSYQQGIFSLITTPDTGVESLEDLRGETIGVGTIDGGEVPVVKGLLGDAGLEEPEDYKLLAVGDGGTASAALAKGDIAAYGAAFVDVLILEGSGEEVIDLAPDGFKGGTDTHYVVTQEMADSDPDLVVRFGRALARGAERLHGDPDGALDQICAEFEEECSDRKFAEQLLDAVLALEELPPGADGQWGWTDVAVVQDYADRMLEQGELNQPVDAAALFTNEFVPQFNEAVDTAPAE